MESTSSNGHLFSIMLRSRVVRVFQSGMGIGLLAGAGTAWGQQDVYWRENSNSSVWWNEDVAQLPWYYMTADDNRGRPDQNADATATGTSNHLIFDNNYSTTSTINGAIFNVASLTFAGGADSSRTFNASGGGGIRLDSHIRNNSAALHTFHAPISLNGSIVEFRSTGGNLAFNGALTTDGNTLRLTGGNFIPIGGAISNGTGTGKLEITGNTTATLTGSNGYTGGTIVEAGSTLRIGAGGTAGAISGTGTLASDGLVVFNRSNDYSYSGTITGGGSLLKDGAGKLSLSSGSSGFSGGLTIRAGSVNWNANSALGTGTVTLNDSVTGSAGTALLRNASGTLSNHVIVANHGTGTTIIGRESGTQNVIYSGTLSLGRSTTLSSGSEAGLVRFSNTISGAGGVTVSGAGTIELLGANTYSGPTQVNQGTLVVGVNSTGRITSNVSVAAGATLKGSGTITGDVAIAGGATHAPGNSIGIQNVSGDLTYQTGSIFEWELTANESGRGSNYDAVNVGGTLGGTDAVFKAVLTAGSFAGSFWQSSRSWADIFMDTEQTGSLSFGPVFSSIQYWEGTVDVSSMIGNYGGFSISGGTLNWTPIPEPTNALAGLLLAAGLLQRSRPGAGGWRNGRPRHKAKAAEWCGFSGM